MKLIVADDSRMIRGIIGGECLQNAQGVDKERRIYSPLRNDKWV